ncbi:hypothetical protein AB0B21_28815 [Streptomyces rimosus]|uniref:hypothetical protein n=1 Tax=Streptomyces rimosus TaxID=1927 RepID=UPI0033EA7449
MLVALVHLRTGLPPAAPAERYGTARSTISRAIGEIGPLPAAHGFAVPTAPVSGCALWRTCSPTPRPGVRLRIDGAATQDRRPQASRPGRRTFVSSKTRQITIETTTRSDGQGRLLWRSTRATRARPTSPPTRSAPAEKAKDNAPPSEQHTRQETPRRQPSKRTCAEHTNAKLRHWHPLQHSTSLRGNYTETH